MNDGGGGTPEAGDRRRRTLGMVAAVALLALALVLALVGGGDSGAGAGGGPPRLVSVEELTELEADLGHPIYWAGGRPGTRIELELDAAGNAFLRYLPRGVAAGAGREGYLTVGTYPVLDAVAATRRYARGARAEVLAGEDGAVVVPNPAGAGVYLAHPDSDLQIEVYDPVPGRASRLVRDGAIVPVGEG